MKNKAVKIVLICAAATLAVCLSIGAAGYFLFFRDVESHNLDIYKKAQIVSNGRMPDVEEFKPCNDISFTYYNEKFAFFESHGYTLTAYYSNNEYPEKKAYFMGKSQVEKSFTHGKFDMIRLKNSEYDKDFPKVAYYYGFNDETRQIVFVHFHDGDIDGISDLEVLNICRFDKAVSYKNQTDYNSRIEI